MRAVPVCRVAPALALGDAIDQGEPDLGELGSVAAFGQAGLEVGGEGEIRAAGFIPDDGD